MAEDRVAGHRKVSDVRLSAEAHATRSGREAVPHNDVACCGIVL